ncbi:uncharacterized protein FRV6_16754 [Fusarium oxysporum]|uniref:Uncharacterized protein n=1 Tax=Fusarium oxysporum TaxID=5507 RepID=A0A2H3UBI4_FUSOX|nr:uncharacterized protein FRV6_16754 [Fusarium oxysporum]
MCTKQLDRDDLQKRQQWVKSGK